MSLAENNSSKYSLLTILFLSFFVSWNIIDKAPNNILSWDAYGHYLYLPTTFILDDPLIEDFQKVDDLRLKYDNAPYFYVGFKTETDKTMIKYPMGFSVLMSPFFGIGHAYASQSEKYPPDGFSKPYQWSIVLGCLFYVLLGIVFTQKMLRIWFSDQLTALLLLLVFFGTNYYFMVIHSQGMVHGILFGFYAMLIYYSHKWHQKPSFKYSIVLGCVLGALALTRASEVIAVLIPLLWNVYDKKSALIKIKFLKSNLKKLLPIVVIYVLWGLPQLIYWKLVSGHFIVDSYQNPGEGFDFLYPHTFDYLFSFRKGWLLYTPLMIFGLIGLYKTKNRDLQFGFSLIAFSILNIYLLSSWTNWWYAESFGQRSIVQAYPVFLIGIGFFLKGVKIKSLKGIVIGISLFLFSGLNMFQIWQVNHGMLHLSRMSKEAYFEHFLRTTPSDKYADLLMVDTFLPATEHLANSEKYQVTKTFVFDFEHVETEEKRRFIKNGWKESQSEEVHNEFPYSLGLLLPYSEISDNYYAIIKVKAMIYIEDSVNIVKPLIVGKFRHHKKEYFASYLDIEKEYPNLKLNEWTEVEMSFLTPNIRHSTDDLQVFGWLMGTGSFIIDDLTVIVYNEK